MHRQCRLWPSHHVVGGLERDLASHAVPLVHRRELGSLGRGVVLELASLDLELAHDQLVLRGDADPLARSHAGRSRDGTRQPRQSNNGRIDSGACEADDQRHVRHQSVADSEHCGARQTSCYRAMTGM